MRGGQGSNDGVINLRGVVRDGKLVSLMDHAGNDLGAPVTSFANLSGVIGIEDIPVAPNAVLIDGGTGASSGWVQSSAWPERFALQLLALTGGSPAEIVLEGSDDKVTATLLITVTLDTVDSTLITAALKSIYPFIRWTIQTAGTSTVRVSRGA